MSLHVERRDAVAVLTLDDPERRNALTAPLVAELVDTLEQLGADEGVGALVVTGAGSAFCAGADLGDLLALSTIDEQGAMEVRAIYEAFLAVRASSLPTVAAVNGPAVGAGFNLALACDVRITSPAARFDARFAQIGLHPGGGHVWMLERLAGPQTTAAMVCFGEKVDGELAVDLGLAWRCVDAAELLDVAVELAARAASVPHDLMHQITSTLRETPWQPDFATAVQVELERQAWSFAQGYFNARAPRP
jgi:enoyl-CoA hydratase